MHTNKHLEKYKCNVDGCDYNGGKSSHLIRHMKDIHLSDISVDCPLNECNQKYETNNHLSSHQKSCHKTTENNSNEVMIRQKKRLRDNCDESIDRNCGQTQDSIDSNVISELNDSSAELIHQIAKNVVLIQDLETNNQLRTQTSNELNEF